LRTEPARELRWLLIRFWYDLIHHSIAIPTVVLFASNSHSLSIHNSSNDGNAGGDFTDNSLESIDKISIDWLVL
jgi:hypothetical protein